MFLELLSFLLSSALVPTCLGKTSPAGKVAALHQ